MSQFPLMLLHFIKQRALLPAHYMGKVLGWNSARSSLPFFILSIALDVYGQLLYNDGYTGWEKFHLTIWCVAVVGGALAVDGWLEEVNKKAKEGSNIFLPGWLIPLRLWHAWMLLGVVVGMPFALFEALGSPGERPYPTLQLIENTLDIIGFALLWALVLPPGGGLMDRLKSLLKGEKLKPASVGI